MQILPPALVDLVEALGSLPGVGPRTAERYAYFLLKHDSGIAKRLGLSLDQLHKGISQ